MRNILFVVWVLLCFSLVSEAYKVTKKVIYRQTIIRKGANPTSRPLGVLPRGTVARVSEKEENDFVLIEVDLEDGKVRGWIPTAHLKRSSWQNPADNEEKRQLAEAAEKKKKEEESEDGSIPLDEGVLMKRESSFVYGFSLIPGFALQTPDLGLDTYNGFAYGAAANLGVYVDKRFIAEGELQYHKMSGEGSTGQVLELGYVGVGFNIRYLPIGNLELLGGLGYWRGISLGIPPSGLTTLTDASDVSTFIGSVGAAYRFKISDVGYFIPRFRFQPSFSQSPVAFMLFSIQLALEFNG